jgi:AAA15 family ATPase/GTPase
MITLIELDNFKSLVDFKLPLAKFNCLVGMNGAGKSTVLQGIDFIAQLMEGKLDDWLKERSWEASDLNSKFSKKSNISFKVVLKDELFGEISWSGSVNRSSLKCTQEVVEHNGVNILKLEDGHYALQLKKDGQKNERKESFSVMFDYQGSILSQLKDNLISETLVLLKVNILAVRSLDLLSPEQLRSRARSSEGKLGLGGQKLSAYLHEQGSDGQQKLKELLAAVYPKLDNIGVKSLISGWKDIEITEDFGGHKLRSKARHINDGLLRLMAILSQLQSTNNFLLFDEIENGINPEIIQFLVNTLVETEHQVLVTTHSPLILNYLEDETAKTALVLLYKSSVGHTKAIRLFDLPAMAEKLTVMGPGEVFADTDLVALAKEAEQTEMSHGKG